jgi:colanic acid/amylovoran biosynthesis protein
LEISTQHIPLTEKNNAALSTKSFGKSNQTANGSCSCPSEALNFRIVDFWGKFFSMKILLMGNHACANRGDCAISRGLHTSLQQHFPTATFTFLSRFPISSGYLSGFTYQPDRLSLHYQAKTSGFLGRLKAYFTAKYLSRYLGLLLRYMKLTNWLPLPKVHQMEINFIQQFDLVIQVGGSNFVDLYGLSQFDYALCTLLANKPLYLIGHSVGPFRNRHFNQLAGLVFGKAQALILREPYSRELLKNANIHCKQIIAGADTAWLVEAAKNPMPESWRLSLRQPAIAVTLRKLYPFDQTLGVSQAKFNDAMVHLINQLIDAGYQILLLSTCTGIDGYKNDDRMLALEIQQRLKKPAAAIVEMRELNDVELGWLFAQCQLTIGTRLHSAIISMNFGTPAFAINYEHKSAGILDQMSLPELALDVAELLDERAARRIFTALNQRSELKQRSDQAVISEKLLAEQALTQMFTKDIPAI